MRAIALSDLHLGYRAYSRIESGRNAREQDVERALERAVDIIVAQQPDLVTIAGDVFHVVRPSLHAVKAYRDALRRISEETNAHVVVIPGNHDAPKTAETLSPVVIPDDLHRVHVVLTAQWLDLDLASGERAAVLCVPHDNLGAAATFDPSDAPPADVRVLVIHAAVKTSAVADALPHFYAGDLAVDVGMLAQHFDIVACGDFHEYRELDPTFLAFYSGSIERTSSNIWPETEPKGVVLVDTHACTLELLPIEARPMFDYDWAEDFALDDLDLIAPLPYYSDVNAALMKLAANEMHRGAIVRLVVEDLPRDEYSLIDRKLTAQLRELCFHFQLDVRFQERELTSVARAGHSLDEEAARFFAEDPEPVRDTALIYLRGEAA